MKPHNNGPYTWQKNLCGFTIILIQTNNMREKNKENMI